MPFKTEVKVVGVSYSNPDGSNRQDILGKVYDDYYTEDRENEISFSIHREPDNDYDKNAIAVHLDKPEISIGPSQLVGYIPASIAEWMCDYVDEDQVISTALVSMGCTKRGIVGVTIVVELRDDDETIDTEDGEVFRL